MNKIRIKTERGFTIIFVMILLAMTAFVVREALKRSQAGSFVIYESKKRYERYYQIEDAFNKVVIYLRENSHLYTTPFSRDNFYDNFVRLTEPEISSNDSGFLDIPVMLQETEAGHSLMLSNHAEIGDSLFPLSSDISIVWAPAATPSVVNLEDDFEDEFKNQPEVTEAQVRLTLVDAIGKIPIADPGASGESDDPILTDFNPIYRLDVQSGANQGGHMYGFLKGYITNLFDFGIFGSNTFSFAGTCDSWDSSLPGQSSYSDTYREAKCYTGSASSSAFTLSGTIHGNFVNNYTTADTSDHVCDDFEDPCSPGKVCGSRGCAPVMMETYSGTFAQHCPSHQGAILVPTSNTVVATTTSGSCWTTLGAREGGTLEFTSCVGCTPSSPYYANNLGFLDQTALHRHNPGTNEVLEIYFWNLATNAAYPRTLYDTNLSNLAIRPYSVRLYYMGTNAITLAGTTQPFRMFLAAPRAQVTVLANVVVEGGIVAKDLIVESGAEIHYDSSAYGQGPIEDIQYRIRSMVPVYR